MTWFFFHVRTSVLSNKNIDKYAKNRGIFHWNGENFGNFPKVFSRSLSKSWAVLPTVKMSILYSSSFSGLSHDFDLVFHYVINKNDSYALLKTLEQKLVETCRVRNLMIQLVSNSRRCKRCCLKISALSTQNSYF